MKINLNIGKGLKFSDNKLTLNIENNRYVEKRNDGLYISNLNGSDGQSGKSTEDNYTIIKNSGGNIQTNPNVVEYIFSMCAYKVIESTRGSIDTYSVDTSTVKTTQEIINEINCCIDNDGGTTTSTAYILKTGNLFQLRDTATCGKWPKWSKAMDDLNRRPESKCLALFYIKNATYSTTSAYYLRNLKLVCLYSSLSQFVKGQEYNMDSKNNY